MSSDSEDGLERRLAAIRGTRFKQLEGSLEVEGAWVVFDGGFVGAKAIKSPEDHLPVALSQGEYAISFKVEAKDEEEFSVVRLSRRGGRRRRSVAATRL